LVEHVTIEPHLQRAMSGVAWADGVPVATPLQRAPSLDSVPSGAAAGGAGTVPARPPALDIAATRGVTTVAFVSPNSDPLSHHSGGGFGPRSSSASQHATHSPRASSSSFIKAKRNQSSSRARRASYVAHASHDDHEDHGSGSDDEHAALVSNIEHYLDGLTEGASSPQKHGSPHATGNTSSSAPSRVSSLDVLPAPPSSFSTPATALVTPAVSARTVTPGNMSKYAESYVGAVL